MAELIFIAATIFVAYTLFTVLGDKDNAPAKEDNIAPVVKNETKAAAAPSVSQSAAKTRVASTRKAASPAKTAVAEKAPAKPKAVAKTVAAPKAEAKPKIVAEKKPAARKTAAKAAPILIDSLKNPKTGEIVKIPNSYAFAKRWIKDALVEEKLLDKIYKNTELDDATNAKILAAIEKLKQLPKYQ